MEESLHSLIRNETNPVHQAGFIARTSTTPDDIDWILEHFGYHPAVWRGLISRGNCTEDWVQLASRIPDAGVLGAIVSHRMTSKTINGWIRDYAAELASQTTGIESEGFMHVSEYAGRNS